MSTIALFDVGGVIITSPSFGETYCKQYALPSDSMKYFFTHVFPKCSRGELDLIEAVGSYLGQWRWEKSAKEFVEYWMQIDSCVNLKLIEEIQTWRKQGITCCIASDQEQYRTQFLQENLGFTGLFDGFFISCDIGYTKSQDTFFEYITQKHPHDTLYYFDDSPAHVERAKKFGIHAFVYQDIHQVHQVLCDSLQKPTIS